MRYGVIARMALTIDGTLLKYDLMDGIFHGISE